MATLGQYFTPQPIIDVIREIMKKHRIVGTRGLEPSVGTGNLLPLFGDIQVDAYEIDESIVVNNRSDKVKLHYGDFLLQSDADTADYDLVIANPPYVEMKYVGDKYKKTQWKEFIFGRSNMYILFIVKTISLLAIGGTAIFIIPTSFRINVSSARARKYLSDNCDIIETIDYGNFSKEVSQDVMIMIVKKKHPISSDASADAVDKPVAPITIDGLGCIVRNGTVMWNQQKII